MERLAEHALSGEAARISEVAAESLELLAESLATSRVVVAVVCDAFSRASDLVVRDERGETVIVFGLPEEVRPQLAGLLSWADPESIAERGIMPLNEPVAATAHRAEAGVSEARYGRIVEEGPFSALLLDRRGAVEYVSPALVREDSGWSSGGLVGGSWLDYVHGDDRERARNALTLLAGGEPEIALHLRGRTRDGGYVWLEATLRAVRDQGDGSYDGCVIGLRGLNKTRSVLDEVVFGRQRERALANASETGTAIIHAGERATGTVLAANRAFRGIMRPSMGEVLGHSITSLVGEADAARVQEAIDAAATSGRPRRLELTLDRDRGAGRAIELAIIPDPEAGVGSGELLVSAQDVSEHRALVGELIRSVDRISQVNRELAEFARVTAHELIGPLRAMSGILDLVSAKPRDPELDEMLDAMRSSIERMESTVDGVLGYVQAQDAEPDRAPVSLDAVVARARDALAADIADSEADVTVAGMPTVTGDESQLDRVFVNLISNALKYAGDQPPRVHVDATRDGGGWRISVADAGIGVEPASSERIFELFGRAAGCEQRPGRGIGLATCRRIVEMHGGHIWVEPNAPRGAIFRFTLPDNPTVGAG